MLRDLNYDATRVVDNTRHTHLNSKYAFSVMFCICSYLFRKKAIIWSYITYRCNVTHFTEHESDEWNEFGKIHYSPKPKAELTDDLFLMRA